MLLRKKNERKINIIHSTRVLEKKWEEHEFMVKWSEMDIKTQVLRFLVEFPGCLLGWVAGEKTTHLSTGIAVFIYKEILWKVFKELPQKNVACFQDG